MKQIDLSRIASKTIIWCKTEIEAIKLLSAAEAYGIKWRDGSKITGSTNWNGYKGNTGYNIENGKLSHCNCNWDWCEENGYTVIPFSKLYGDEKHTHSFTTKYTYGDSTYLIAQVPAGIQRPMCNGTKLYDGERCPVCHATGTIQIGPKEWKVVPNAFVIDHFRVSINAQGVSGIRYYSRAGSKPSSRAEENLFETVESAQEECNRRNLVRVEIALADIKISSCFAGTIPAANKLANRVDEYKRTGKFATEIYVTKDMELWDGYTTYMVCRMLDIKAIKVVVKDRMCEVKPVGRDEDDNENDWMAG